MQGGLGFTGFTIVFTTRSCTTSCKDLWMVSPGCLQDLSTEPVQGHAVSEDFTRIYKDLLIRTCKYKIIQERLRRFPQDQDLSKIFSQGPVQDHARISSRISVGSLRDFLSRIRTRSRKTPLQKVTALSTRSCHKVSTTRAKESDLTGSGMEKVVRWLREQAQNSHTALGSDLTPRKCGDGCKSDVKIRIRLKRERSDTHKVPRGLREWNFATAPQWKRFLIDAKCRGPRWLHEHMLDFHHKDCAHHQLRIEKQRCLTKVTWNY